MSARTLADLVLAFHFAFIVFAALGGFLVLWKLWIAWLHAPSVLWAGYVNLLKVKQGTDVGVLRIVGTSFGSVIIAVLPDGRLVGLPEADWGRYDYRW